MVLLSVRRCGEPQADAREPVRFTRLEGQAIPIFW
jgi:hypothetical protein